MATVDWGEIVQRYRVEHRANHLREVEWFRSKPDLETATRDAVNSRDEDGRCYDHQRRIGKDVYSEALRALRTRAGEIGASKSFDELHRIIGRALSTVYGAGEMFVYDIAARLGAFLRLELTVVYLHAGTAAGARRFGFARAGDRTLQLDKLPPVLRRLGAAEVENILCIYAKD